MGVIRFNGISSADFGCTIERRPNHTRGSRRGELIEIPGRNGAIVLEDGSYSTYVQQYVVAFEEGDTMPPYKRAEQVAAWLLGSHGFCRLEDDFEPDVYRMARYAGPLNIEQVASEYGRCVIEFECQPQRYLKSGEMQIEYTKTAKRLTKAVRVYNIPEYVSKIKVISSVENTIVSMSNPTTGRIISGNNVYVETVGYVTEIETQDGYTTVFVRSGRYIPAQDIYYPVGNVNLFMVGTNGVEENVLNFDASVLSILNPTGNEAKPLLRVEQNQEPEEGEDSTESVATINGTTVTVDFTNGSVVYLDCDLHDAYYPDGSNANSAVTFASEIENYPTFPSFTSGEQQITVSDNLYYSVKISPRWWAL